MYWYIVNSISCDVSPIFLLSQAACGDDDALRDLGAAATAVTEALNTLIQGIKDDVRNAEGDKYDEAVEAILAATERLFRWGAGGRIEAFSCWGAGVILKIFLVRGVKMNILSCSLPPLPFPPSLPPLSSMGNAQEMVRQAKLLAEATSSLINAIKREAEAETDPDARKKLLDAAKSLADATALMVEAAKVAARNPQDERAQEKLRRAAEHLRSVCV